jgi:MFS family permease
MPALQPKAPPWYAEVTRYQWIVLVIASLGWVFDIFEGQIFVASMNQVIPDLTAGSYPLSPTHYASFARPAAHALAVAGQVGAASSAAPAAALGLSTLGFHLPLAHQQGLAEYYKDLINGCFLLGGALGGVFFGIVSDRIGRTRTMVYTILMYSLFTCVSALAQTWWHMAICRFLVAMGVGGEWAVASAMVAEVFPPRARAVSLGIFHASSVLGTYLAVAAGAFVLPALGWRSCFVLGALPALLTIWIRLSLKEPEGWQRARTLALHDVTKKLGSFLDLFAPDIRRRTLVGIGLGTVGLATFWGAHIYGKELMLRDARAAYERRIEQALSPQQRSDLVQARDTTLKRWEMTGMLLVTTGGGLGLLSFGPLSERLGRRGAFLFFHLAALVAAVLTFQFASGVTLLFVVLPVFGFLTLGMHAGYAIYFPELFPTRLRGTGAGLCFNLARLVVFPILLLSGWLQRSTEQGGLGLPRESAASWLSLLFLLGAVLLVWAPETRGSQLPE